MQKRSPPMQNNGRTTTGGLCLARLARVWDVHIFGMVLLLVGETIGFFWIVRTRIVEFFPPAFDQVSYYLEAYELIERVRAQGWWLLLKEYTDPRHFNGIFSVQGAVIGLLFGPSRAAILSINLIYF